MKRLAILSLVLTVALVSGCATIVTGNSQEVSFQSTPDGATVTVNGRALGKTPLTVRLTKETGQAVTFSKDGYTPVTMQLSTSMNAWFWGNIVIGGVFGSTTDAASGAINEYSPNQYMVTLQPEGLAKVELQTSQSDHDKIKQFVMVSYDHVIGDIKAGKGDYLASLFTLMHVKKEDQAVALRKLRALSELYDHNIPDFAEQAANLKI